MRLPMGRSHWKRGVVLVLFVVLSVLEAVSSVEQDYYKILELPKDCSERDVTRAYRKQALKWHPDKNRDNPKKAEERFKIVSEAYEVLHDPEKRKLYDMYGKEGVFASAGGGAGGPGAGGRGGGWSQGFPGHGGMPNFAGSQGGSGGSSFFSFGGDGGSAGARPSGGSFGGFTDPRELFEGLFGGSRGMGGFGGGDASSLFGDMFGSHAFDDLHGLGGSGGSGGRGGGGWSRAAPGRQKQKRRQAGPPLEKEFWCTLRELYEGCEKKMKVTDTVTDPWTGHTRKVSHVYRITVKPGWKEGTRVTFPPSREGLPSICFVLRQKRHRYLRREGDSLVYECRLSEDQARRGVRISVPLLSKVDPPIELTTKGQDVYHNKEMLLPGLGMPTKSRSGEGGRGSFKIKFLLQQRSGKASAA